MSGKNVAKIEPFFLTGMRFFLSGSENGCNFVE